MQIRNKHFFSYFCSMTVNINMTYPYSSVAQETILMRQDRMEWFCQHARRTRNTFIMHCVAGHAKVWRNMHYFDFSKDMEWTLLPDSVIQIVDPSDDFEVRYCVCPPSIFDEVIMHLPSPFIDYISTIDPYTLTTQREIVANSGFFRLMQVIYEDRSNRFRHQLVVNEIQSFYLALYDKIRHHIDDNLKTFGERGDGLIKRFWGLLHVHYLEHRPVSWYASRLCVSERYLSQTFNRMTGTTPKKTIDDFVVLEIKIQLRSTSDSIQQIADRLNFSDQSVMGRFFKNKTGMSPLDYRRGIQFEPNLG